MFKCSKNPNVLEKNPNVLSNPNVLCDQMF
jgi:hypothetical protein